MLFYVLKKSKNIDQPHSFFFKQMVRYFLGNGIVHSLGYLIHQSHKIFVEYTSTIQIVWSSNQIGQSFRGNELVRL